MKRNENIYTECDRLRLSYPDIPARAITYYGQCGEDYLVLSLLRALQANEGIDLTKQRYLEVGANHPVSTSATYLLHTHLGMTGVLVEANPSLIPSLAKARPHDILENAAITDGNAGTATLYVASMDELSSLSKDFVDGWENGSARVLTEVQVPAMTLNKLVESHFLPQGPLFISIDVEGRDYDILRAFDFDKWRPYIIQAEPSPHFNPNNDKLMRSLFERHGYHVIAVTDVNMIAIDKRRIFGTGKSLVSRIKRKILKC